jgi:TfoX/Sxy family transcriptional regulator of competence genes
MQGLKIPRASEEAEKFFMSIVPKGRNITIRPMFGNKAAFVSGKLFIGLYGDDLLLRLPEEDAQKLLRDEGATEFEPMKGRTMRGYVVAPRSWKKEGKTLQKWVARSLEWTDSIPSKPT